MTDYGPLLVRIAARAAEDEPMLPLASRPGPLGAAELDLAERRLGFPLHPLLRAVYRTFANGGFGPDYQLFSLIGGPTAEQSVDVYLANRSAGAGTHWAWPEGVLPVLSWGCGMYACVDCRSEQGTVLLFEPNPGDPDLAWYIDAPSLEMWFDGYVSRTGWWDKLEDGDEPDLQPWPDFKVRASG
ncbi:SMI1/KNR4 family protein [Virgisporangium aliadipatigenens]|uniref:SMI1/KNR4 family protein n=1 Tax=Virgisporangium aliadipatigenens TaxID=741659 RepID=A0A8J3YWA3_9ACTN|nr:SMI1/KNR4 family protein [Virgisporangium aliadipatigenens]GIJ50961.1 SMI1/KNR4 family protein [Virgisporangium aliadipatigenens]